LGGTQLFLAYNLIIARISHLINLSPFIDYQLHSFANRSFDMPILTNSPSDSLAKAKDFSAPSPGTPYSIPLPGSEKAGRSKVYRQWNSQNGLLETLDPTVRTAHDIFEQTGELKMDLS